MKASAVREHRHRVSERTLCAWAVIASALLFWSVGCGETKVYMRGGEVLAGEVIYSDAQQVSVATPVGMVRQARRDEIVSVEHPGRWKLLIGGGVALAYTASLAAGWVELRSDDPDYPVGQALSFVGATGVLVGLSVVAWGAKQRADSMAKFTSTAREEERGEGARERKPRVVPGVVGRDERGAARAGVVVLWSF